jgi:hypothetical protein
MICTEFESAAPNTASTDMQYRPDEELCLCKGEFVAVVQPQDNRYGFFVRDLRRERPTIHGYGVDFSAALTAVTQLLDALPETE